MERRSLQITVFVSGALVMAFEIVGARVLSPYIGTSIHIWTSLIGVVLASLSFGYWLGGKTADAKPDRQILAGAIFMAGGLVALTVLVKEILLSSIAQMPLILEFKAIIASLLLFAPASICLGFVTPFAARLSIASVESSGRTVGGLYALSTIGSIVGTFTAGFFLIPFVGSTRSLYLIATVLILNAALISSLTILKRNISAMVLLIFAIIGNESLTYIKASQSGVIEYDTQYSSVRVFDTVDPRSSRPMKAVATDPYFVQSAAFPDSNELALEYTRFYHLARHYAPLMRRILVIGGAGYSVPKSFLERYPDCRIDVVEIDPMMTAIAREHFGLRDDQRLNIIHEDGRLFLNRVEAGSYDVVLIDAFGSLFSVPHHLTTIEAVTHVKRILNENGVVILNLGSSISGDGDRFLHAQLKTYRAAFTTVELFKVKPEYTDDRLQNVILTARQSSSPMPSPAGDNEIEQFLRQKIEIDLRPETAILTDDLAPIEHFNSTAHRKFLSRK